MTTARYTRDHEWIRVDGEVATVGISGYAQDQLGDVVYVELPEIGRQVEKGEETAVVESVKAASEVYAPVAGEVVAVNGALEGAPGTVNTDAEGNGWFFKIRVAETTDLAGLMTEEQYQAFLETIS
jgi:glycine cleavage system H protein